MTTATSTDSPEQSARIVPTHLPQLRIAVIGNQGNYGYRLCNWLRAADQPTDLFLIEGKDQHARDLLSNVEQNSDATPDWITTLRRFDARLKNLADDYDVVLSVGPSGLKTATQIDHMPIAHFAMGSDVHELPFVHVPPKRMWMRLWDRAYYRFFQSLEARNRRSSASHVRQCLQRVDALIAVHEIITRAAATLGLQHKLRAWAFPEDIDNNRRRVDASLLDQLNRDYAGYDKVLLWMSRLIYLDPKSPSYKGVEHFLHALKHLVHEHGANVCAIVGQHGSDFEAFKIEVEQAGLSKHVHFVPQLPFWKLLTYMSIDNVVVCDALSHRQNVPAGLSREALSLGCALMTNVDPRSVELSYGAMFPAMVASDTGSCLAGIQTYLAMSDEEFTEHRRAVGQWADSHLHHSVMIPKLVSILQELVYLGLSGNSR